MRISLTRTLGGALLLTGLLSGPLAWSQTAPATTTSTTPAPIEVPLPEPPAPQEPPRVIAVSKVVIDELITCVVAANQYGEFKLQCLPVATMPPTAAPTTGTVPKQ